MPQITIDHRWNVKCQATLRLPLAAQTAWGELRDFTRHASHDTFHAGIEVAGGIPRAGAVLKISHRYLWFDVRRIGRILRWREWPTTREDLAASRVHVGRAGYTFSDLSRRGPRYGFPHIFTYDLSSDGPHCATLHIIVRGRWTLTIVPRWLVRLWIGWVFAHVVIRVRNDLLRRAIADHLRMSHEPLAGVS